MNTDEPSGVYEFTGATEAGREGGAEKRGLIPARFNCVAYIIEDSKQAGQ